MIALEGKSIILEDHIGKVLVNGEDDTSFYAKVRIVRFKGQSDVNLRVSKKEMEQFGAKSIGQSEFVLSAMPRYILSIMRQQLPHLIF